MSTTDFRGGNRRRWISNPGAGRTPRDVEIRGGDASSSAPELTNEAPVTSGTRTGLELPVISWPSGREGEGGMGRETSRTRTRPALLK